MKEFLDIKDLTPLELLKTLDEERNKFADSDMDYMSAIVKKLVEIGVYPVYGFNGRYTAETMVSCFGIDWHQFDAPHYCPKCQCDLRDWENGVPGKREILVKHLYDCDMYYICPECKENITEAIVAGRTGKHGAKNEQPIKENRDTKPQRKNRGKSKKSA